LLWLHRRDPLNLIEFPVFLLPSFMDDKPLLFFYFPSGIVQIDVSLLSPPIVQLACLARVLGQARSIELSRIIFFPPSLFFLSLVFFFLFLR